MVRYIYWSALYGPWNPVPAAPGAGSNRSPPGGAGAARARGGRAGATLRLAKPRSPRHFDAMEGRSLPLLAFLWFAALGTSTGTYRT